MTETTNSSGSCTMWWVSSWRISSRSVEKTASSKSNFSFFQFRNWQEAWLRFNLYFPIRSSISLITLARGNFWLRANLQASKITRSSRFALLVMGVVLVSSDVEWFQREAFLRPSIIKKHRLARELYTLQGVVHASRLIQGRKKSSSITYYRLWR